ncbi:hypothetical protein [uncultured Thiodictyon sp.]|uniref:hypothetical protein n=1 Tax=uncultured Thiodictyon sp. TaxID=1846217 RepID=UPI0025E343FC|nr:hypothetical protein [uncultured Thiodictyon sp.]
MAAQQTYVPGYAHDSFVSYGWVDDQVLPSSGASAGWVRAAGGRPEVITAIRRHLGLEPFQRDCRLFISYRRRDGSEAAQAIYRHLRVRGFDAFLDTEDIRATSGTLRILLQSHSGSYAI